MTYEEVKNVKKIVVFGSGGHAKVVIDAIRRAGDYEIYLDGGDLTDPVFGIEVEINGKETFLVTSYQLQVSSQSYIKLGEMELGIGEHEIEFKNKIQNTKIILVGKEEREKQEKVIRGITQLENMYYSLSKGGKFYMPRESDYVIKKTKHIPQILFYSYWSCDGRCCGARWLCYKQ